MYLVVISIYFSNYCSFVSLAHISTWLFIILTVYGGKFKISFKRRENSVINLHVLGFKDYQYSVLVLLSISPNFGFADCFKAVQG